MDIYREIIEHMIEEFKKHSKFVHVSRIRKPSPTLSSNMISLLGDEFKLECNMVINFQNYRLTITNDDIIEMCHYNHKHIISAPITEPEGIEKIIEETLKYAFPGYDGN